MALVLGAPMVALAGSACAPNPRTARRRAQEQARGGTPEQEIGANTSVPVPEGGEGNAGVTDSDSGPTADVAGQGRGTGHTGFSDSDSGANADPAGHGRSGGRRTSVTDSDTGANADPAGNGRGHRIRICPGDPRCRSRTR